MKLNKIIFPMLAAPLLLTGCYDEKMEWHTPEGHNPVTSDEIPLQLQEEIDHYDYIKNYMAQNMPETPIGVGLTANYYIDADGEHPDYAGLCDAHFQQFVTGNAMKMDAMVNADGTLNTATLDAFTAKVPGDKQIFGHNFIWHTQQEQAYLYSLIAPEMIVETDGDILTILRNGDFEMGNTTGWNSWGNSSTWEVVAGEGFDGSYGLVLNNPTDAESHAAQLAYDLTSPLTVGQTYVFRAKVKSSTPAGSLEFAVQNSTDYSGEGYYTFSVGTDWTDIECEFTCTMANMNRMLINFGAVAGTYYIDNVEFGTRIEQGAGTRANRATRATTITYILKTPKEKRQALLEAMESWIGGMLDHVKNDTRFVGWDVINEPITDDGYYRGIDNHFGGNWEDANGLTQYDAAPVENEETGLTLNWGDNHFYWGYYLGMDYATRAFEIAREHAPAGMKLYVNEYGLETNPTKLAKLIDFVNYIDQNSTTQVDGIATQMHVQANGITREQVDQMFQTLAATGKLVRVSELDVALGTSSPTQEDLQLQSDVYQMIIESYKANVPEAQRGGFVVWTLSDAADEHEYWLKGDKPNLFDENYGRKIAYKGLCDGIAGYDIGADFSGDMWKDQATEDQEDETGEEAAEPTE